MQNFYKLIIFDGHGTLTFPKYSTLYIYTKIINQFHPQVLQKHIIEQYYILKIKHYKFLKNKALNHIKVSWEEDRKRWFQLEKELFQTLGVQTNYDELSYKILNDFMDPQNQCIYKDVEPTLNYLKMKGYKIGLLTNSDNRYKEILRHYKVLNFFDQLFISSEIGYKKPNLDLFQYITQKVNLAPENIIYIGDNYKLDIVPAKEAGWKDSILVIRKKRKILGDYKHIYTLKSLKKIL